MLSFEQIKELIELVADRGLEGVEIDRSGFRVKIDGRSKSPGGVPEVASSAPASAAAVQTAAEPEAAGPAPVQEDQPAAPPDGAHVIPSPIVGTFYAAANTESPQFVRVGDRIDKGQVLCIVEAMKLMNEIESDVSGVLVEVFPKNAQPVEFGEPLFAVQTD